MYNFDKQINRSSTNSEKWNKKLLKEHFGRDDIIPMWVADMDFEVDPQIKDVLWKQSLKPIFGYEKKDKNLIESIITWHKNRFDWSIEKKHIRFSSSILNSISSIINIFSEETDGVIIQPPVFFHFKQLIIKNNREVVTNPLKLIDNKYEIDFEDLEKKAESKKNKILILCNPHNPIGRVWTKDELIKIDKIATKHNLIIISDEIHNGIIFKGFKYTAYSAISKKAFSLISPAKTYNIPTVSDSLIISRDEELLKEVDNFLNKMALQKTNIFNQTAMKTAYNKNDLWLEKSLIYIEDNLSFIREYLKEFIPKVKLIEPEGTFLIWLDFRDLGLDVIELKSFLADEAKIALNAGYWFGREGAGFARMTIACPKQTLKVALEQLKNAVNNRF